MNEEKIVALQKSVNETDEPLVRAKPEETSTTPKTRKQQQRAERPEDRKLSATKMSEDSPDRKRIREDVLQSKKKQAKYVNDLIGKKN